MSIVGLQHAIFNTYRSHLAVNSISWFDAKKPEITLRVAFKS